MARAALIIGVDAGGTKTTSWLAQINSSSLCADAPQPLQQSVDILGRGGSGPGNPRALGYEKAVREITTAIYAAYADAGLSFVPPAAACLAVAGAGRAEEQNQLKRLCARIPLADRLAVVGDAVPVLAAAYGTHPIANLTSLRGIALISGTGSLAWGCNGIGNDGNLKQARTGGWGYLLGDQGSGYWIALAALRAACRAADGIGPATRLLPVLLQHLQLDSPADLIQSIYGQPLDRRRLAQLAPIVMKMADPQNNDGDAVATQIVERAADDLAIMVRGVHRQLGFEELPPPLALAGGVLLHGQYLRKKLADNLSPLGLPMVAVESPVLGALYMAAALAVDIGLPGLTLRDSQAPGS